ncbi:hypothetical protein BKA70DRAFT_676779 [Coprinopsis sp. MPI-PUGE-AT-0042]|nr:hypothetical protein BKA70DRAFT_676779 [Coprinopsis sp. MPI-PUGE-AT-0042]
MWWGTGFSMTKGLPELLILITTGERKSSCNNLDTHYTIDDTLYSNMPFKLLIAPKSRVWDTVYETEQGQPLYRTMRTQKNNSDILSVSKITEAGIGHNAKNTIAALLGKGRVEDFLGSSTTNRIATHLDKKIGNKVNGLLGTGASGVHSSATNFGIEHQEIASIRLRSSHPDEITMNGVTVLEKNFFTKKYGSGLYGNDRIFTGPDGQEYRWKMRSSKPELVLNNSPDTIITKFHREHSGALGLRDKVQASLEISIFTTSSTPSGMEEALLDMILVTFAYVETIRAAREEAAATVAGEVGGAVGGA